MFKGKGCKIIALILVCAFMFTLTACGGTQKQDAAPTPAAAPAPAAPPPEPVKIGLLTSQTGALQAYGAQHINGFKLGIQYATGGTNKAGGRDLQFIYEDTETKPEVAKQKAIKLYEQDKVDFLVGCASSTDALAVVPLAEEYQKIMVVEPAVADTITGAAWNKYIFRTGRNSSQDAAAGAAAIAAPGRKIGILAQDNAYGRDGGAAFKKLIEKLGASISIEEYADPNSTDITAHIQKLIAAKPDYVWVIWAGANTPWQQLQDLQVQEKGVKLATIAADIAALKTMQNCLGVEGFTVYHHLSPVNPEAKKINDWLVAEHKKQHNNEPPDIFTAGGFAAAMAVVAALEKTNGDTNPDVLIAAMEGMSFDTPKGKMTFRKEDHQALQVLYAMKLEKVDGFDYPIPVTLKELTPEETAPPIMNQR